MKFLKIICISLILSSCVSLNTHQSGRSIGKDNVQFFGTMNYGKTDVDSFISTDDDEVFIAELGGYYGITDKTDIGLKIGNSSKLTGLLKSQIIGDNKSFFASSLATDIGIGIGIFGEDLYHNANAYIINSIHPTNSLAFTLTPKYVYSIKFRPHADHDYIDRLYGYSTGIIIGEKLKFSIEVSQFTHIEKSLFKASPFIGIGILTK